jgi:rhamnopyranosyl-N-acetylglucosaminyl-diphospho-decaprenol beta-1,3/1,4-galactofuranosyltransferase
MPRTSVRIAVVVVTRDRPALLQQALAALRLQSRQPDAIYVVDNASIDDSAVQLGRAAGAIVLRLETNLGGAGGFARGMAEAFGAGYDWIWLLDDDAIARPDALARLLDALSGPAAGAGAVCGAVWEFGDAALRHRRRFHRHTGIERPLPRRVYENGPCRTDTASFVGFLVSSTAIARAGLPERSFFLAYDDTEYTLRLGRAGLPVWLVPGSVVEHLREPRARLRAGPFGSKHYFTVRNRIAVARRYASLPFIAGASAVAFGVALWLLCLCRHPSHSGWRILLRAVLDGWHGRLGPFPAACADMRMRQPARPGTSP